MISSMLKLLTIVTLLTVSLYGSTNNVDKLIEKMEKNKFSKYLKRRGLELKSIEFVTKKKLDQQGWYGYIFNLKISIKEKTVDQKHIVFSNGSFLAPELFNLATNESYRVFMNSSSKNFLKPIPVPASKIADTILKLEKAKLQQYLQKRDIKINEMDLALTKELELKNWIGYAFNINFTVKGEIVDQKHFVFSNGKVSAPDLVNLKSKRSLKDVMYPNLTKKYFSKEHFIAGNPNAKNTLVIFSDPLCPICIDEIPMVIKNVMDNPKNIALYYYHMPLDMHPLAKTLSKASMVAKEQGIKNIDYKVYDKDFSGLFDPYEENDPKVALKHFNKIFKTNITIKQINDKKYEDKLQYDIKMAEDAFVNGTPTMFFNGVIDKTRSVYEQYLK